jgi:hypothetical protein
MCCPADFTVKTQSGNNTPEYKNAACKLRCLQAALFFLPAVPGRCRAAVMLFYRRRCRAVIPFYRRRCRAGDDDLCRRLGIDHLANQMDNSGGEVETIAFGLVTGTGKGGGSENHDGGEHHNFSGVFHFSSLSLFGIICFNHPSRMLSTI